MSLATGNKTIGQVLSDLRQQHWPDHAALSKTLKMSYTTYLSVERDQRELSFLMALRLCRFYGLDLHEFISLLSDEELDRPDRSVLRQWEKIERRKKERQQKGKVIGINDGKPLD